MLCRIADLFVDVPTAGGLAPRCVAYYDQSGAKPDIVIDALKYRRDIWPEMDEYGISYMESGVQFHGELLRFGGMMLHASAVLYEGKVYLFSGPSGTGKSTHTKLWLHIFGDKAQILNDDKPALRRIDGVWYAYGTPWSGKDGINLNTKAPIAGICFLKQAKENSIRPLMPIEAVTKIISQTRRKFLEVEKLNLMLTNVELLVKDIPVFEFENRPEPAAALISYETMHRAALERML